MLMASLPIVGNDEYALLRRGGMRVVNNCEMRCQVMMTYLMTIEAHGCMILKVNMLKVTAANYMYTWVRVVIIHNLPVMTCIRMDTEFLMPTALWIHLSADRGLSSVQELYKRIARNMHSRRRSYRA